MGYTTEFSGKFNTSRPFTFDEYEYLSAFSNSRRMKRDAEIVNFLDDPLRLAVGIQSVGYEGEFYVNGMGFCGQDYDHTVVDYNNPPSTQPGLWCQWIPSENQEGIVWNGGEKFYHYIEWLQYIITNFMERWDILLNGSVKWRGEDFDDIGTIFVHDNIIEVAKGQFLEKSSNEPEQFRLF